MGSHHHRPPAASTPLQPGGDMVLPRCRASDRRSKVKVGPPSITRFPLVWHTRAFVVEGVKFEPPDWAT